MIQEIKKRLSCVEYLSRHGIYVKNGGRCVSPLRPGAKNPTSFWVDEDRWYDFGSGYGGDVIDLAAQLQFQGDNGMAIRSLAAELGIQSNIPHNETWREDIQQLCNRTAAYHAALTPSDYEYLSARGFTKEDADRLMIGRVTDGYLKGRLFLPYFRNGAVVYYATRVMPGSGFQENKYMKASLNECQSYQHIPWGLQTLNRQSDMLIISEGYFDAVSWEREGYPVISPITGNFSKEQWPDVISACKMFKRVLIIFDNDAISHAGDGFTARTSKKLFQNRIPFLVGHTPQGIKDVNDYYVGGGSLQALIDSAEDGLKYMISQYHDAAELKNFVMSINRYVDSTTITSALFTPTMQERFNAAVLKSIDKAANSAPSESCIVDEIIAKHNIIYVDQIGFYEWNKKVWELIPDETVRHYADKTYGKNFTSSNRITSVCKLLKARSLQKIQFNKNPVMTFQNGTLEIETGKFRDFSEADYCSICMDYDYNPEAQCPTWEQFIDDVTDEEPRRAEVLQFIPGYTLMPDCRYQKIFWLIGGGSNGKSLYLEIIQSLFGNANISTVPPSGLPKEFQRILLKDSILNIAKDVPSDCSTGEIREWLLQISDGTLIQACYKSKTHVTFEPRPKLVFSSNDPPTASSVKGLERRFVFVKFPCEYVDFPDPKKPKQKQKDVNLAEKLRAELPGIFNWAYAGYKLLNQVGYFTETPEQAEIAQQFRDRSDPVKVFCEDHNYSGTVSRDEIYQEYKFWCQSTGHKELNRENFLPKFRDCLGDRIIDEKRIRIDGALTRVFVIEPGT